MKRGLYNLPTTPDALPRATEHIPFDDHSVDAVVCVGVMTYLPDVEQVWREFARVARAGGLVVVNRGFVPEGREDPSTRRAGLRPRRRQTRSPGTWSR